MGKRKGRCDSLRGLAACLLVICIFALGWPDLFAQSAPLPVGLPARAPGYDHYYRSEQASTVFATRWGYFDGYQGGKHDREFGKEPAPTEQDRYKLVPDHGVHPDLPRAKYKTIYQQAYLQGYAYAMQF
jgi:hypothetical protein